MVLTATHTALHEMTALDTIHVIGTVAQRFVEEAGEEQIVLLVSFGSILCVILSISLCRYVYIE